MHVTVLIPLDTQELYNNNLKMTTELDYTRHVIVRRLFIYSAKITAYYYRIVGYRQNSEVKPIRFSPSMVWDGVSGNIDIFKSTSR